MDDIWLVLVQFVFRLTFGMSLAMAVTPSSLVSAGFYRVHLWVLMGLNTFAALAAYTCRSAMASSDLPAPAITGIAIALAVISYIGAVVWLYERKQIGAVLLYIVAVLGIVGAALATSWSQGTTTTGIVLGLCELVSSGLLLGATMAAMFLGHWYLNTPSMTLTPLKRLVAMMIIAVILRSILAAVGLWIHLGAADAVETMFWVWIAARWILGLLGALMMALLAWYTLKVPNTQSATGILYAGVIVVFMGELFSQLLSVGAIYTL
jgi:hypothetical protein